MIYDILEAFKKEYKKQGEKLILGSYNLKDGLYVKIGEDKKLEFYEAKNNSFTNLNNPSINLNGTPVDSDTINKFKEKDYCSSYINSNKSLFDKKLHSINYLTYFFKAENLTYAKDSIDTHFNILLNFSKFNKKEEKEILENYKEIFEDEIRKDDILKKCEILKDSFNEINRVAKQREIKNYIKIFFDEDIEDYKKESNIYLSLKIFNDNSFNQKIEDKIYGLSNSNMGLNAKKPFLENRTRKYSAPFMIENEDALMLKKFFDWLKIQTNKDKLINKTIGERLNEHFFIQKQTKNDEAEITDFDYIPLKESDVQKYFEIIEVKNYLKLEKDKMLISDYEIKKLFELENVVDKIFYNNQLKFNYFNTEIKISSFLSKDLQTLLYITRYSMINYFKKYDDRDFYNTVKKYFTNLIINHLKNERYIRAKEAINLKLSLLNHKGEKIMDIENMQENMLQKIKTSNYEKLNSQEFFYLCGQITKYLLLQSKSGKKEADMLEPFLRAKNCKKLKDEIKFTFFKYKHEISLNHISFNNAMSLILAYEDENNFDSDSFLIGVLSKNIFFIKNLKEGNEDE